MELHIVNSQRRFRLDISAVKRFLCTVVSFAERRTPQELCPWRELVVHFVCDEISAQTNAAIVGHEGATDVVTQRYDAIPGEQPGLQGELFVNVQRAWEEGNRRRNWSPSRELALYLAHGCDHLTGADDFSEKEYRSMRRRELSWLRRAGVPELFKAEHS